MMKLFRPLSIPIAVTAVFFILYTTLALIKHFHYLSGYDLAIVSQVVWEYGRFQSGITTINAYAGTPLLWDHVEFIYLLITPLSWIVNSAVLLIVLQSFLICISGIPVYVLCKKRNLPVFSSMVILVSYLAFYGVQFAIWSDVHSNVFGVSFLPWFVYFLEEDNLRFTSLFFILAVVSKEDIALLTGLLCLVYYIASRKKSVLMFGFISLIYLFSVFIIYFPHFTPGYRYQNPHGLLADAKLLSIIDTQNKRNVILYSLGWFGFLPIIVPLYLLPAAGDIAHFFVLGGKVTGAQGLFEHYRVSLVFLLTYPTLIAISKFKFLQSKVVGIYLLVCVVFFQYYLHLPLSYFFKSWFWKEPQSIRSLNLMLAYIPRDAALVSQNNITPHVAERRFIYTLWPDKKDFIRDSPCGKKTCDWFRWNGKAEYLIVDTSPDWDERHFLTDRNTFLKTLANMETSGAIIAYKVFGTTKLYKIQKKLKDKMKGV